MNQVNGTPDWLDEQLIVKRLDAREMLAKGEHPLGDVLASTASLTKGQIFELTTPFTPQPLIDKVKATGFVSFSMNVSPIEVKTYFLKM